MQMSRLEAGGVWEDPQNALMGKTPRRRGDLCMVPQMHIRPHDAQEADESLSPNWILMVISLTELISISPAGFGGWFELGLLWAALVVYGPPGRWGWEHITPSAWPMGPCRGQMPGAVSSWGGLAPSPAWLERERGFCCDPSYHPNAGRRHRREHGPKHPRVDSGLNPFSPLVHPGHARSCFR